MTHLRSKCLCSWHQGRGTQGPWYPSGRSCLNVPVAWRSRRVAASPSFPKNPFKEHGVCTIAGTTLCQLLNLTGRFCSSFSWNVRQKVLLGWFPLLRKPLHLLHLGNGEAATWSPSAAGEPCPCCHVASSRSPPSTQTPSITYMIHLSYKEVDRLPELERPRWMRCAVRPDCRMCCTPEKNVLNCKKLKRPKKGRENSAQPGHSWFISHVAFWQMLTWILSPVL